MKIRSICGGIILSHADFMDTTLLENKFLRVLEAINSIAASLSEQLYIVQSKRVCTNPFGEYTTPETIIHNIGLLNELSKRFGLNCLSIGPAISIREAEFIPTIIDSFSEISASIMIPYENNIPSFAFCLQAGRVVGEISKKPVGPLGNFRFCASFCLSPGVPFFPAAYTSSLIQKEPVSIVIGLENSDLLFQAFYAANHNTHENDVILQTAKNNFKSTIKQVVIAIQSIVLSSISKFEISNNGAKVHYYGIDTSINPVMVDKGGQSFETTVGSGLTIFSSQFATTPPINTIISLMTSSLHEIQQEGEIVTSGYNGIMLPIMEDANLARTSLNFNQLLMTSCFCGVGIDCVPIRYRYGNEEWLVKLGWKMVEFGCICVGRSGKQLTWRVFPVEGDEEVTRLDHPSLVNAKVFDIDI